MLTMLTITLENRKYYLCGTDEKNAGPERLSSSLHVIHLLSGWAAIWAQNMIILSEERLYMASGPSWSSWDLYVRVKGRGHQAKRSVLGGLGLMLPAQSGRDQSKTAPRVIHITGLGLQRRGIIT